MTFSDTRVVDLVKREFIAVWESVSDVPVAVFDLGEGKQVKGTVGGEIAIYFCRPDGRAFDILPALQSPNATYHAIAAALAFYQKTGATEEAVREMHAVRLAEMVSRGRGLPNEETARAKRQLQAKTSSEDGGTRALGWGAGSKTSVFGGSSESLTVVEPGGLYLYLRPIDEAFSMQPMVTPGDWKGFVFPIVLEQKLEGGETVYDVESLVPLALEEQ